MAITLNGGTGVITGVSVGGLPDGVVDSGTLATNSVDSAELIDGSVDSSHLASGVGGGFEVGARAYSAVNQTFSNATRTIVELEAESYDLNSDFNTTTDRYVVPTTGEYLVIGGCKLNALTSGATYQTELQINGSLMTYNVAHTALTANKNNIVSDIYQLSATDYVQLSIYQTTGSDKTSGSGEGNVFLAVHRLS